MPKTIADEGCVSSKKQGDMIELELADIDSQFRQLDNMFNKINEEAKKGYYIRSIVQFTRMLPETIVLIRRMINLEKRVDKLLGKEMNRRA